MATLMKASHQWSSRPADERFTSLTEMQSHFARIRNESRETVVPSRRVHALPDPDNKGLFIVGPDGEPYTATHWSFGQVAQLSEAPAGYLRTLPAPIAADCVNYGLQFKRSVEDVGFLLQKNGEHVLRAATGPRYGRIWNDDIVSGLVERFGDGVSGDWRVPGEFGKAVTVTKNNTTLYASDRDMFVFLADEINRVEIPNRRNGPGTLARGFFVWNSEVGSSTFGIGTFLFDYVCMNRIVWGAQDYQEVKIRHTPSAPVRWLDEVAPALEAYKNSSTAGINRAIEQAQERKVGDDLQKFLAGRFSNRLIKAFEQVHEIEEGRPIETVWDAVTGITAYARGLEYQDARVDLERKAGDLLKAAA